MTAFVILAAGPGTRMGVGVSLHKALLPLDGRAIISHQVGLAPPGARVIVCTGNRAQQVRDYLELAHPGLRVTLVDVLGWDQPGNGPGASLLAARGAVGDDDMVFTSCDTLWKADESLWDTVTSWAGTAPIPPGTPPERWCRISATGAIFDKIPEPPGGDAYIGLSMITREDLNAFWTGVENSGLLGGELQVTGGLRALNRAGRLVTRQLAWTDTGDEAAYQQAVKISSGYDWSKPGEATYVLSDQGRVVKFQVDQAAVTRRIERQARISRAVPLLTGIRPGMFAYEYVPGVTAYAVADRDPDLITRLLTWANEDLWRPVEVAFEATASACAHFYLEKTATRIEMLQPTLKPAARRAVSRVQWGELASGCDPVTFHGDFNFGNVIVRPNGSFAGIDWREDFAGEIAWGDRRYDLGKLAAGLLVNWDNARRGDFRPWPQGERHMAKLAAWFGGEIPRDVMIIAALSLLNCAPLHVAPLDTILVTRAAELLEKT